MLGLKVAPPLFAELGRELSPEDLETRVPSPPTPIKQLRARHHAIARALAMGQRPGLVAATFGYDPSRISILQADPSFRELVEHYRGEETDALRDMRERMVGIAHEVIDELENRLETEPERIPTGALLSLLSLTADRTGHGPKTVSEVNVNVGFAERLRAARERMKTIDVTPIAAE